jgi:hypothetical protein
MFLTSLPCSSTTEADAQALSGDVGLRLALCSFSFGMADRRSEAKVKNRFTAAR